MSDSQSSEATPATDRDVIALLQRYDSPTQFHAVRTRFLGNIASSNLQASTIQMVEALWGGELPAFDNLDAANELLGTLVMGLWNRLSQHQERSAPFRLMRLDVTPTRVGLAQISLMRRGQLDGFVDGQFGSDNELELPERAHRALETLATMPVELKELGTTLKHLRELTRIAENEINEVVLACTRARRQFLQIWPATRPSVH